MSDWAVGDLALCVDATFFNGIGEAALGAPRAGGVYAVIGIEAAPEGFTCLDLHDVDYFCDARQFRKIRPDAHDACEAEFRILLQLSKKRVSA